MHFISTICRLEMMLHLTYFQPVSYTHLVKTAGATVVGRMIQNLEHASSATYIGSGKVEELKDLIWETEATAVVCDDELTPAQYKKDVYKRQVRGSAF